MTLRWVQQLLSWFRPTVFDRDSVSRESVVETPVLRSDIRTRILISRYDGDGDAPSLQWKPCHPSTVRRFKAEMTCPRGHGLTLKGHAVSADGMVSPSVVCPARGCDFHRFVSLANWTFGDVPR